MMNEATTLFEDAMAWLREHYADYRFFTERDIVWTVQMRLITEIDDQGLPYRVFNDYRMLPGKRRGLSADLVILHDDLVEVAIEFKYEPSHKRTDIPPDKFDVVSWSSDGVGKDVQRVHEFVSKGKTGVAYAVFIDEGQHFRHRSPHPGSEWIEWEPSGPSVLWSRVAEST